MNRSLRLVLLVCAAVSGLFVAMLLVRNYEFDSAARALKTGDYRTALHKLKPLAHIGDTHAQYVLADMYATGTGVVKNDSEAIYWFRRAAIGAHGEADAAAAAELAVAKDYAEGIGVEPDPAESIRWLRRAAEGGNKEAADELQKLNRAKGP
jgi:uncharacterized protein